MPAANGHFKSAYPKEMIPMRNHIQPLRKQEETAKAHIGSLVSALRRIDAEIKKADIAMAREIKRLSR